MTGYAEELVRYARRRYGAVMKFSVADHEAFRNKIAESEGDSLPSLVYADYLDEQGMPAHAEFLRRYEASDDTLGGPVAIQPADLKDAAHVDHIARANERWGKASVALYPGRKSASNNIAMNLLLPNGVDAPRGRSLAYWMELPHDEAFPLLHGLEGEGVRVDGHRDVRKPYEAWKATRSV